jgi:hypothetical protein
VHDFYWDASALAKRYAPELGTSLVNHLFASVALDRMMCLVIGTGEVISILVRRPSRGPRAREPLTPIFAAGNSLTMDRVRGTRRPLGDCTTME